MSLVGGFRSELLSALQNVLEEDRVGLTRPRLFCLGPLCKGKRKKIVLDFWGKHIMLIKSNVLQKSVDDQTMLASIENLLVITR